MSHNHGYDWKILELAPRGRSYVDVGAGFGVWGLYLRSYKVCSSIIAIEGYPPFAEDLKRWGGLYDEVICKNILDIPEGSIKRDVAISCDVIEHQDPKDSDRFLEILESLADTVILSTPNGHCINDVAIFGNELNRHRSFYDEAFFKDRGYKTSVIQYAPRPPKIFRPLIDIYWRIRGGKKPDSQIVAFKSRTF